MEIKPNMRIEVDYEVHFDQAEASQLRSFLLQTANASPVAMRLLEALTIAHHECIDRERQFHREKPGGSNE